MPDGGAVPRRAVVTGVGATTPAGGEAPSTWAALLAGRSGVRRIDQEWAADLPVRIAGRAAVEPADQLSRAEAHRMDRAAQLALVSAREAWVDAGEPDLPPERLAVSLACGAGGVGTLLRQHDVLREKGWKRVSPLLIPMFMPNSPAAWVSLELNAQAEVHSPASACASGAEAIARGLEMIRAGRADVVVAGGAEAMIHPIVIAGFAAMHALSQRNDEPQRACRPFDKSRDGFVLGEGAGVVVLESAEHAARRGARVYAELAGAGRSADAHHIAQPHPSGAGAALAMRRALADAGRGPEDVAHVSAHATATPLGDTAEAEALWSALGPAAAAVTVTAVKSMIGHMLGAAGAVESIATILSLHHGVAPPTINVDDPDDDIGLDIVRGEARRLPAGAVGALTNSFAFGGHNVSVLFSRPA
jgi:3-oxoacyl-[acyl-carrier-protein] synthase II